MLLFHQITLSFLTLPECSTPLFSLPPNLLEQDSTILISLSEVWSNKSIVVHFEFLNRVLVRFFHFLDINQCLRCFYSLIITEVSLLKHVIDVLDTQFKFT